MHSLSALQTFRLSTCSEGQDRRVLLGLARRTQDRTLVGAEKCQDQQDSRRGNKCRKRLVRSVSGWLRIRDSRRREPEWWVFSGRRAIWPEFPLRAGPLRIQCMCVIGPGGKNKAFQRLPRCQNSSCHVRRARGNYPFPSPDARSRSDITNEIRNLLVSTDARTYSTSIILLDN
jgi:hypothetical protein